MNSLFLKRVLQPAFKLSRPCLRPYQSSSFSLPMRLFTTQQQKPLN